MPISGTGNSNRSAGFTLVELGVVLFLVALFSALLIPLMPWGEDRLGSSVRRLSGTAKYIYNETVLSGRSHRFAFDLDRGEFWGEALAENGDVVPMKGVVRRGQLPDSIRFTDVSVAGQESSGRGVVYARVYPSGWMDETVIYLKNARGEETTLRVAPLSGGTEVHEGHVLTF